MSLQLSRLSTPMVVLAAVVALGLIGDGIYLVNHFRTTSQVTQSDHAAQTKHRGEAAGQHPCNHGFYVSQAAHSNKGKDYKKAIAKSDLGKNGDCSAPLPAEAPAPKKPKS